MTISVIVPCFNEEESIPLFHEAMEAVKYQIRDQFEYIFVNDGSTDQTLPVLRELSSRCPDVHYLSFSRNFGKEAALYAGLQEASGDFVTVMDVDLQDPPELLVEMKALLDSNPELDCVGTRSHSGSFRVQSLFQGNFCLGWLQYRVLGIQKCRTSSWQDLLEFLVSFQLFFGRHRQFL